jgi:hypothetical protein
MFLRSLLGRFVLSWICHGFSSIQSLGNVVKDTTPADQISVAGGPPGELIIEP